MVCAKDGDQTEVADYIADMAAELAVLAAWAEHTDLARILEMARLESERLCGRGQSEAAEFAADDSSGPGRAGSDKSTNVILLSAIRAAQK